jgi:hypothetical protein
MTPVPKCPGYFWDTVTHKLYSIKIGGVLREMRAYTAHPAMFRHRQVKGLKPGDVLYRASVDGLLVTLPVFRLKKLKLVDYAIPVINRT